MSGPIDIISGAILLMSLIAAISDLWRGKIYNGLTLPAMVLGPIVLLQLQGWSGVGNSLLGILLGFAAYGWMFWLGFMGAGDVKLLMALGAWGGPRYAWDVAILAILLGGGFSLLILIFSGSFMDFLKRMYHFFLTLFMKELEFEAPRLNRKLTLPFGIPISVAATWVIFANPMRHLSIFSLGGYG